MTDSDVKISLSRSQVDQIIRAVRGQDGNLSALLMGLNDSRKALGNLAHSPLLDDPKFSRSLLLGLLVLASFPSDGSECRGKDVADLLGMSQTTAHRYITTLTAAGLLERNPRTREYRLAV
jgi:DNA-binding MarR family transcriptional regulator